MTDLSQLIERVEAATGPDRELDVAIILALHPEAGPYNPHCQGDEPIFWNAPYYKQECPHLTASLDAALTLLPEGWTYQVSNRAPLPNTGRAYLHNGELIYAGIGFRKNPKFQSAEVVAATPALALCAAILKARQTAAQPANQAEAR